MATTDASPVKEWEEEGRGRSAGLEEVRVRGGGDHLPGGKKASAAFVNSTIETVSWATGESGTGGGRWRTKERGEEEGEGG